MNPGLLQPIRETCERHGIDPTPRLLFASVADQRLIECRQVAGWEFVEERRIIISTSRNGVGQADGSEKTPLGLPRIAEQRGGRRGRHHPRGRQAGLLEVREGLSRDRVVRARW